MMDAGLPLPSFPKEPAGDKQRDGSQDCASSQTCAQPCGQPLVTKPGPRGVGIYFSHLNLTPEMTMLNTKGYPVLKMGALRHRDVKRVA